MTGPAAGHDVTAGDVAWAFRVAAAFGWRTDTPHLVDEWESVALVGLAEAAATYPAGAAFAFRTHASRPVRWAVSVASRAWGVSGPRRRLRGPLSKAGAAIVAAPELAPAGDGPVGWEVEWEDEIACHARLLPWTVRRVFVPYYTTAGNQADAGRRAGLGQSKSSLYLRRAHATLAAHYRLTRESA